MVIPIQAIHLDPDLYPDPLAFRPDRWNNVKVAAAGFTSNPLNQVDEDVPLKSDMREISATSFMPFLVGSLSLWLVLL